MIYQRLTLMLAGALLAVPGPAPAAAGDAGTSESDRAAPAVAPPAAGMGQIVFYRSSRMGMMISCRVREGEQVVNRLPPGKYFILQASPGVHEYTVSGQGEDLLRLEIEEGETQYVRCEVNSGQSNLSPQSREDFDRRGRGLDLLPPYAGE